MARVMMPVATDRLQQRLETIIMELMEIKQALLLQLIGTVFSILLPLSETSSKIV